MATTRIIPLHLNKGKTIKQCLSERLDYGKNPDKTENGELVSSYACDPETADADFALSKREYFQLGARLEESLIEGLEEYGYLKKQAAELAVNTVREFIKANPGTLDLVEWALFDDDTLRVYKNVL